MAMAGMPTTVALGISRKADGSELATTSLPPTIRMSMPRKMYRVASVTTRLGTRPTATMMPLSRPHPRPMPSPARKAAGIGEAGVAAEQARGQVRGQAQHRANGQVVVSADDDHRLAQCEQREHGGVDQDELDVRDVEEPGLDQRRHGDEQDQDDDDARFPDPEGALGEPARAGTRGAGGCRSARPGWCSPFPLGLPWRRPPPLWPGRWRRRGSLPPRRPRARARSSAAPPA